MIGKFNSKWLLMTCTAALLTLSWPRPAFTADAVVYAVLFYSPTCPHCHQVLSEDLPPLLERYGDQLNIVAVNTSHPDGQTLFRAAVERFKVPAERQGVPALVIGDVFLVGSLEIPQQLPGLVDVYLEQGGVGWPDIPGLLEIINSAQPAPTPTANISTPAVTVEESTPTAEPVTTPTATTMPEGQAAPNSGQPGTPVPLDGIRDLTGDSTENLYSRFRRDLLGNSFSVLVLLAMVIVTLSSVLRLATIRNSPAPPTGSSTWRQWAIPILVIGGLGISAYMTFVETTHSTAICGPVGDCNTVQQSDYARLFGLIPIGLLGILGYWAIGLSWAIGQWRQDAIGLWAQVLLFSMALFGSIFSVYLTFLEPFVIGATCMWCLSSAIAITLILLLANDSGGTALVALTGLGVKSLAGVPGDSSERSHL